MNYLLVGRPNVGKSSIFNILTGKKTNLIHKEEGTTRDWHREKIILINNKYIYDTPGLVFNSFNEEEKKSIAILKNLISKSDVLLFVIDIQSKFNIHDHSIINWLRKFDKKILLLINKRDDFSKQINVDYFKLGINNLFFLSCEHRLGFDKLNEYLKKNFQSKYENIIDTNNSYDYSIAIFGKPNAGKSTFLNTLLGYERSLTSPYAGTTSDYVIDDLKYKSSLIRIIDTAGIGRKSKIDDDSVNYYAIKKTLNKIKDVDSTMVIIDSSEGIDRQDKRIINLLSSNSKSLIIVFNKIDLIKNILEFKNKKKIEISSNLYQLKNIKFFFVSAFSKKQILNILDYIYKNILSINLVISTSSLNTWLKKCTKKQSHPLIEKKKVNFKYAVKIKNKPITIKIFCNYSYKIKKNYIRYLTNNFNAYFKIYNQNTKIIFSNSQNPYK